MMIPSVTTGFFLRQFVHGWLAVWCDPVWRLALRHFNLLFRLTSAFFAVAIHFWLAEWLAECVRSGGLATHAWAAQRLPAAMF